MPDQLKIFFHQLRIHTDTKQYIRHEITFVRAKAAVLLNRAKYIMNLPGPHYFFNIIFIVSDISHLHIE